MIITDVDQLKVQSKYLTVDKAHECGIMNDLQEELKRSKVPGCGLAAIQMGRPLACFIMIVKDKMYKVVNPTITDKHDSCVIPNEGCLSFPGRTVNTDRYMQVTVRYDDYDTGKQVHGVLQGEEAVVFQHEYDHCAGITMLDREHTARKLGRNDPCYCGSGKKYKKCCLNKENI